VHCVTSTVSLLLYKSGPQGSLWFPYTLPTAWQESFMCTEHGCEYIYIQQEMKVHI